MRLLRLALALLLGLSASCSPNRERAASRTSALGGDGGARPPLDLPETRVDGTSSRPFPFVWSGASLFIARHGCETDAGAEYCTDYDTVVDWLDRHRIPIWGMPSDAIVPWLRGAEVYGPPGDFYRVYGSSFSSPAYLRDVYGFATVDELNERAAALGDLLAAVGDTGTAIAPYTDFGTSLYGVQLPGQHSVMFRFWDDWGANAYQDAGLSAGSRPTEPPADWLCRYFDPRRSLDSPGTSPLSSDTPLPLVHQGLSGAYSPYNGASTLVDAGTPPPDAGPLPEFYRRSATQTSEGWASYMSLVFREMARAGHRTAFLDNVGGRLCWNEAEETAFDAFVASDVPVDRRRVLAATPGYRLEGNDVLPAPPRSEAFDHGFDVGPAVFFSPGGAGYESTWSYDTESLVGPYALRMKAGTAPWTTDLPFMPGSPAFELPLDVRHASFFYKSRGPHFDSLVVEMQAKIGSSFVTLETRTLPEASDWTEVEITPASTTPNRGVRLQFSVVGTSPGNPVDPTTFALIDEVQILPTSQEALAPATDLPRHEIGNVETDQVGRWESTLSPMQVYANRYRESLIEPRLVQLRNAAREVDPGFAVIGNSYHPLEGLDYYVIEHQVLSVEAGDQSVGTYPGRYVPTSGGTLRGSTVTSDVVVTNVVDFKMGYHERNASRTALPMHLAERSVPVYRSNLDSATLRMAELAAFAGGGGAELSVFSLRSSYTDPEIEALLDRQDAFFEFVEANPELYEGLRPLHHVAFGIGGILQAQPLVRALLEIQKLLAQGVLVDVFNGPIGEQRIDYDAIVLYGAATSDEEDQWIYHDEGSPLSMGGIVVAWELPGLRDFDGLVRAFRPPGSANPWPPHSVAPFGNSRWCLAPRVCRARCEVPTGCSEECAGDTCMRAYHDLPGPNGTMAGTLLWRPDPIPDTPDPDPESIDSAGWLKSTIDQALGRDVSVLGGITDTQRSRLRASVWTSSERTVVHLVNYDVTLGQAGSATPVSNVRVRIPLPMSEIFMQNHLEFPMPTRLRLVSPEPGFVERTIPFSVEGGVISFVVPEVNVYTIAVLDGLGEGAGCSPNPCLHGGTCSDAEIGYVCACASGYTGSDCYESTP